MSLDLPSLHLVELHFRAIAPVRTLPHYHGPHWNGLFNFILKPYLPPETGLAQAGFWIHPIETGMSTYEKDEPLHLGLTFPEAFAGPVLQMLKEFNELYSPHGHFQPGRTVVLEKIVCCLSGQVFSPKTLEASLLPPLFPDLITSEIQSLSRKKAFTLCFHVPLRMKRPAGFKQPGHQWVDPDFFLGEAPVCPDPLVHLIRAIDLPGHSLPQSSGLAVCGGALTFLDNTYGGYATPIGGIMGLLRLTGRPTLPVAKALVAGQYLGLGKNRTFGLGFYHIPEIEQAKEIRPWTRGKTLLERATSVEALRKALERLPNSSPGPDGLSKADLKKAGDSFLKTLGREVLGNTYMPAETLTYKQKKKSGGYREILVQNFTDRVVQRAAADVLQPAVETILSRSAYAFRKGLNRKGAKSALQNALNAGYTQGLKADISAFFDSVNLDVLSDTLHGLFSFDPLPDAIMTWLRHMHEQGAKGLPQGSPLSPGLSNLYLDRFDKAIESAGFRLIRYADDFVVLGKNGQPVENCLEKVERALTGLHLQLSPEKTQKISKEGPINFLGYRLVSREIIPPDEPPQEEQSPWPPVFTDEYPSGYPVYLSSICRGAYSSGPDLVVKMENDRTEKVPWHSVSRIVIVGRSSFSAGVVYRAVKEGIPITFIDVMGRSRGQLFPTLYDLPAMALAQEKHASDTDFCLDFAKAIVSAKIHNRAVILRRNNIDPSPLRDWEEKVASAKNTEQLRGYEGSADRVYFKKLAELLQPFEFKGRSYHPPDGPVNVMLSFGYTLLYNRLASVLRDKGYSSRISFYHQGRGKHFALASDLMEELRHVVDRTVLSMVRKREIQQEHFAVVDKNSRKVWRLSGEGFRRFIHRFEHTMSIKFSYHGGEKMSCNAYLDEMADGLKRTLKLGIPYLGLRIK